MQWRDSGNAIGDGAIMAMSGWGCLPMSVLLAIGVALISMRLGPRPAVWLRAGLVALLLPGLLLVFRPVPAMAGPTFTLLCRAVGTLPLLVLPLVAALARVPPGQVRAATGLGAGRAARIRLLWLPQLGPACLAGLVLAGAVDAAALTHARRGNVVLSAPGRPA